MKSKFPHVVPVPPEYHDATLLRGLEETFGPAGDQWQDTGDSICFCDRADADVLAHVLKITPKRMD